MSELAPNTLALERAGTLPDQELMALGMACVAAAQREDLNAVVAEHERFTSNPNTYGAGLFLASGEVSMSEDKVYRQVGMEAVADLAMSGVIRNGATAQNQEHPRWGHKVFWNEGADGKKMSTGGRFVIEAPLEAAATGWVRADQVTGIHTRTADGSVKNILELR